MKWWGWVIVTLLLWAIVGFVISLAKLTLWLIWIVLMFTIIVWLVGWVIKTLNNVWPG